MPIYIFSKKTLYKNKAPIAAMVFGPTSTSILGGGTFLGIDSSQNL